MSSESKREYYRKKCLTDPEFRRKRLEYGREYERNRYRTDPEFRRKCLESWKNNHKQTCDILRKHHEDLKDDPEHLTTEFMKKLIGVNCNGR